MTDVLAWMAFCFQLLSMLLSLMTGGTEWRSLL
jgi:hypothetical protein